MGAPNLPPSYPGADPLHPQPYRMNPYAPPPPPPAPMPYLQQPSPPPVPPPMPYHPQQGMAPPIGGQMSGDDEMNHRLAQALHSLSQRSNTPQAAPGAQGSLGGLFGAAMNALNTPHAQRPMQVGPLDMRGAAQLPDLSSTLPNVGYG